MQTSAADQAHLSKQILRREHVEAVMSLTPAQRRAVGRLVQVARVTVPSDLDDIALLDRFMLSEAKAPVVLETPITDWWVFQEKPRVAEVSHAGRPTFVPR